MVAQDRKEKDRIDVKNALEEYVYNLRDKLEGDYRDYVTATEKTKMVDTLNALENWLYEDGEDQEKSVYAQKLEELQVNSRHVACSDTSAADEFIFTASQSGRQGIFVRRCISNVKKL